MGLNFCAILAFDDKIVKLFFSLFLVVGFYIVTVVPGLVASGMSGFHIMHESMQTPTHPHPGTRWGFDKSLVQILTNPPHPGDAVCLQKSSNAPTTWGFPFGSRRSWLARKTEILKPYSVISTTLLVAVTERAPKLQL